METEQPSRRSVIGMAVVTGGLAVVTAWLAIGMTTGRELAGFFVALVLTMAALIQTLERAVKRAEHQVQGEVIAAVNEENTGLWFRGPGEVVTVTFDPAAEVYRMTDGRGTWQIWDDLDALHVHLIELEDAGWAASSDVGTRLVRAALDLPGWEYAP